MPSAATVLRVEDLGPCNDYVYDLETSDGTFAAESVEGYAILLKNTDSCYVKFPIDKAKYTTTLPDGTPYFDEEGFMRDQWEMGEACARTISSKFKRPINIELEKFMYPFALFEKKRYVYAEWAKQGKNLFGFTRKRDEDGRLTDQVEIECKGMSLVRREYCDYAKEVCTKILEILMEIHHFESENSSIQRAADYTVGALEDLFAGKVPMKKLIMSQSLAGVYKLRDNHNVTHSVKWYKGLCKVHGEEKERGEPCGRCRGGEGPFGRSAVHCSPTTGECAHCRNNFAFPTKSHVAIAVEYMKKNPSDCYKPPDRVPFVFVKTKGRVTYQCERTRHPNDVKDPSKEIDYNYYFEKQMKKNIDQIFSLSLRDTGSIYKELVLQFDLKSTGQTTITSYFKVRGESGKTTIVDKLSDIDDDADPDNGPLEGDWEEEW